MSYILRVRENVHQDNSINNQAIRNYLPYSNTSLNKSDEIRIPIQTQDAYTLPSESSLWISGQIIEEKLKKASDTLTIVNNGLLYLFEEIRYELNGLVIDKVRNPGVTSTLKNFVSLTPNETNRYENACWSGSSKNPNILDEEGKFNVCIPLNLLLGFCEDYKKILVNIRQELVLLRSSSDLNCVVSSKADEVPIITINKIVWRMPHIQVNDSEKLQLLNIIDRGADLQIAFRGWELHEFPLLQQTTQHTWNIKTSNQLEKPRYIIFALQTDRKNTVTRDVSNFQHCNLKNIKLFLNSTFYPYENLNLCFGDRQIAIAYDMYSRFQQSYYHKFKSEPCVTLKQFIDNAPLFVIDCSQQNESLKNGSVDIRLDFETEKNIPPKTCAYCLILNDRLLSYNPLKNTIFVK